ncbi:hypothetical protein [Aliiroseovarius sp. F20344]|uniref:hypothetical protein n=1 Tax=Aliiroseovarius sp. F20344 TaxID=2926414 RepID=UPI001FF33CFF|nr:hypothetical protein [Aliiroseovarius sp. F20344]MCK0141976.1 hypothetical protein [Aliiroseovarius sp. F20344]
MHIEIEREIHNLTLEAIIHGRRLAEEWLKVGCVPKGTTKHLIRETLEQLRERQGFNGVNDDFIEMMGNEIRRALNEYRDGIGDRAISGDVDTVWEQNNDVIKLVNLAWRWKEFRAAKRAVDDKLAAVRQTDLMFASVT